MSDVRKSVPAKVIASLLILVSVFSLCWQGWLCCGDRLCADRQLAGYLGVQRADPGTGGPAGRVVRGQSRAGGSWTGPIWTRCGMRQMRSGSEQQWRRIRPLSATGCSVRTGQRSLATNLAARGSPWSSWCPRSTSAVFRPGEHLTQPWNSSPDAGDPALVTEGAEESGDAYYIIECGVPQELSGAEDEFSELHARDTGAGKRSP